MRRFTLLTFLAVFFLLAGCTHKEKAKLMSDTDVLHLNEYALTQVIIYDVFTPPVAARIYGYTSLASYEAMRYSDAKYASIAAQLKGFGAPPEPANGQKYNYTRAATKAFCTVAHKVTFSIDTLKKFEARVYGIYKDNLDDSVYARSISFGEKIG